MTSPILTTWGPTILGTFVLLVFVSLLARSERLGAQRRTRALNAAIASRGWHHANPDDTLPHLAESHPFDQGEHPTCTTVIRGALNGHSFVAYTYTHDDPNYLGDGTPTIHTWAIVGVEAPSRLRLTRFDPEDPVRRGNPLGEHRDLDVESAEFNDRWQVVTSDTRITHALLNPRMIDDLLDATLPHQPIVFAPGVVYTYRAGPLTLQAIDATLPHLTDLVELIPAFLTDTH